MSRDLALRRRVGGWMTPLFRFWWRRTRAMTLGVRGAVFDEHGRVCLVRHSYIEGFHLPGGGVEAGEDVTLALERELAEEAGVVPVEPPALVGLFRNRRFAGDHIALFRVESWRACDPAAGGEITDIVWAAPDALPRETTPATARRIAELVEGRPLPRDW